MLSKSISIIALMLVMTLAGSAQDGDTTSESTQDPDIAFHGIPDCDYPGRFCVWGRLYDATGPNRWRPKPMKKGPIDVCARWDFNCSNPSQTVCQLHGPHGFQGREGSYFFILSVNQAWRVKPRVAGSHLSWYPSSATFAAGSVEPGTVKVHDFFLLGTAPSTDLCNF